MIPTHNTGLIPEISDNIWLGSQIRYEVRLPSGNWIPYASSHEKQKDPIETMACVSFSLNNVLEAQYKFFGKDVNFSDRALAKMSDTQMNGNTFERVADTARKKGLLLEHQWSNSPKAQSWAEYYRNIPQDMENKAVKQNFQYGVVPRTHNYTISLQRELKQSPLWITVYEPHPNHAISLLHVENSTKAFAQDHYTKQIIQLKVSDIAFAAKVVLTPMNPNATTINIDGTIYAAFALNNPADIPYINKFIGTNLYQDEQGNIPTDIMATKK